MADWSYSGWGKAYLADLSKRKQASTDEAEKSKIDNEISRVTSKFKNEIGADVKSAADQAVATAKQRFNIAPFKNKMASIISTKDAYTQAGNELNPAYQQARTNAGIASQQQQALLRQQLGARGQLSGGLANQGAVNLSGKLLGTLADLDTSYASQKAARAAELQDTDYARKQQDYTNALNAYQTTTGLDLQTQQANYNAEQDAANMAYQKEQDALNRAYQQARDSIADEQWKKQFDEEVRQYGLNYALQKLESDRSYEINKGQLAVSRASLAQRSSGGSKGDTGLSDDEIMQMAIKSAQSDPRVKSDGYGSTINMADLISEYKDYYSASKYATNYPAVSQYLSQMSPQQALSALQNDSQEIIDTIGKSNFDNLLKQYAVSSAYSHPYNGYR